MEAGLKLKSNEARDTSTIHCLVTADVPLNPSATKQWYYITNPANRAGQWLQVQYWFHLTFQRLNDKAIYCTVRIVSLRQTTVTINHFYLSYHSKDSELFIHREEKSR